MNKKAIFFAGLLIVAVVACNFFVFSVLNREVARHELPMDLQRFTSKEGNFSILMPGVPQKRLYGPKTSPGMSQTPMVLSAYQVNPFFQRGFAVAYVDPSEDSIKGRTLAERLDDGVKGLFLYQKGKLIRQKQITFFGQPGREVRYDANVPFFHNMQCVSRMFYVGKRSYNLMYADSQV
jgi:hypothetical protein